MDKKERSKLNKRSRAKGKEFELKVRKDLEKQGWIVCKWQNNVGDDNLGNIGLIPVKPKFNPFTKSLMMNSGGFPDFICLRRLINNGDKTFEVFGVESKFSGSLTREEQTKCSWLLANNVFGKILIASKGKERGVIDYEDFLVEFKRTKPHG